MAKNVTGQSQITTAGKIKKGKGTGTGPRPSVKPQGKGGKK